MSVLPQDFDYDYDFGTLAAPATSSGLSQHYGYPSDLPLSGYTTFEEYQDAEEFFSPQYQDAAEYPDSTGYPVAQGNDSAYLPSPTAPTDLLVAFQTSAVFSYNGPYGIPYDGPDYQPLNSQMLASNSNGHGPFQGITPSQQVADERYPNIRVRPESPASPPNSVQTKGAAHKLSSEEVNDDNHKHGEGPDHGSDVAPVTERSGNLTKKVYNSVKRTVVALARKIRIRRVTEKNVQNSVFTATKNLSPDPVTQLLFNDAAAVKADDDQICFQPDPRDRTIPIFDEDQQEYVLDLVNAIKDNGNVVEKTNNASFIKRWSDQATYYTEESFNKLAWYIVTFTINLHQNGWTVPIYDDYTMANIKATENLTYRERMDIIIELLSISKHTCEDMLKGERFFTAIGSPHILLERVKTNALANDRKGKVLKAAAAAEKAKKDKPTAAPKKAASNASSAPRDTASRNYIEESPSLSDKLAPPSSVGTKRKRGHDDDDDVSVDASSRNSLMKRLRAHK